MKKPREQIEDALETIYERHEFKKMVEENQDLLAEATLHLMKAYRQLFKQTPSPEIVKDLLRILLECSHPWITFTLDPDVNDKKTRTRLLKKLVEEAHSSAMEKIKEWNFPDNR